MIQDLRIKKGVVTRFPPSPTGNLHIGSVRTALFNYLFAKQQGGKMHLRLENTDVERSKTEYEKNILDSLEWLGLQSDPIGGKPFWRQSERIEIYRGYLKKLLDSGKAYLSSETNDDPVAEGLRRASVIRFKNPNVTVAFDDLVRGTIAFETSELGDFVIAKSEQEPLYHLAVVVDDYEMGVTHVIRGEDHISNTPRQILLQEALGFPRPTYAHIPLILAPDRSRLSKRHGAVAVTEYRDRGYLPEALLNYLALIGWNPGTNVEIFSLDEIIKLFDLSKVQKGGAIFNEEKLRSINKIYLKKIGGTKHVVPHIPNELLVGRTETQTVALAEMLLERISVFADIRTDFEKGEFDYLLHEPTVESAKLSWKNQTPDDAKEKLHTVEVLLQKLSDESFTKEMITKEILPFAETAGKGNVLWPMRMALSGKDKSPDPFTLAVILGKDKVLKRLRNAQNVL